MKTLIVPLDFSIDSLKGLEVALLFARQTPMKIQLVHVQKRHDVPSQEEEEYIQAEKNMKKLLSMYQKDIHPESHITYIIKKGKVYQEVVSQAEAFKDSIIITSTHGASGFEEIFIGSNTYRIVCSTQRPVITIRQMPVPKHINNIILPIDINIESRQKVVLVSAIAQLFSATVHVVLVSESKNKKIVSRLNAYGNQVVDYLKRKNISYQTASLIGIDNLDDLFNFSQQKNADLIAIINETGTTIADLITGSLAQKMISKSPIPILIIRPKPHTIKESFNTFGG